MISSPKWQPTRLGPSCSKIGSGATPLGGETVYQDDGIALIRSQNIYNGQFTAEGLAHISDEHAQKLKGVTVEEGDILLNITGDSVARCCRVPDEILPARVNQHVLIIRPNDGDWNRRYLMYYLISPFMQSYMLSIAGSGGTRNALTKEMVEQFVIPHPKKSEQDGVASVLSNYDDLIENNLRRIALLEESARLLYKEWFVRLRFPGYEHTRITNAVPEGWEKKKLGEVIELKYGKSLKEENRIEGEYPVYGSSGIVGTHNQQLAKGPGIVVGRKGNAGSVFWSHKDFFPIDTVYYVGSSQSSYFVFHDLLNQNFQSSHGAVPGLNREYAYSLPFIAPKKVLKDRFEETVSPVYAQIFQLREMNDKLRQARDILLLKLMSGEVEL